LHDDHDDGVFVYRYDRICGNIPCPAKAICSFVESLAFSVGLLYSHTSERFSEYLSIYSAFACVTALSYIFSFLRKAPITIFLTAGLFPLIPGSGIYEAVFSFMFSGQTQAYLSALETLKLILAIVLGVVTMFELVKFKMTITTFSRSRKSRKINLLNFPTRFKGLNLEKRI